MRKKITTGISALTSWKLCIRFPLFGKITVPLKFQQCLFHDSIFIYLTAGATLEEDCSEALAADAEEDEDDEAHPGDEDGEDGVVVTHLLPREPHVGGIGEGPHHHEQEVGYGQALALSLKLYKKLC